MTRRRLWLQVAALLAFAAVVIAAILVGAASRHSALPPTPSPRTTGSAPTPTVAAPTLAPTVAATPPSVAPVVAAAAVGRASVLPLDSNEGMIHITQRVCGTSSTWVAQANANHVTPPNWIVLTEQRLDIDCSRAAVAAPAPPPAVARAPQAATSAAWVRPLGHMGCFQPNGSREFGISRPGHMHGGIDLGAPVGAHYGDPIYAIHSGTAHHGYQAGGAGTYVWVDHGDGSSSWYFHMSSRAVADGAHVNAGTVIGYVGQSGNATSEHLHLETKVNGSRVDPVRFLADRGVRIQC